MHPYSEFIINSSLFNVRWYGFLISVGVLAAYVLSIREIRKHAIPENKFDTLFLLTLFFGIIGARLGFVLQNTAYFGSHLSEIFKIWDGGLSIHGALILGAITMLVASKILKLEPMKIINIIAPNVLLAGAIGRWGNFFNQEIIGKPTSFVINIFINENNRPAGFENYSSFHPVFLYESVLLLGAFIIYQLLKKKIERYSFTYTLTAYSLARIIVEFWRIDYKPIFLALDLAQIVSFGIILITLIATLTFRQK